MLAGAVPMQVGDSEECHSTSAPFERPVLILGWLPWSSSASLMSDLPSSPLSCSQLLPSFAKAIAEPVQGFPCERIQRIIGRGPGRSKAEPSGQDLWNPVARMSEGFVGPT